MDKVTYIKKVALWAAAIVVVVMMLIGLCFGSVIEESLFAEISKWIVMTAAILAVIEGFIYLAVGPLMYHFLHEKRNSK